MARFRKIDPRMWNDEKFRILSDDGKLSFVFLLTHPFMTSLGAMRATLTGLAAELGWTVKRFEKGFREPFQKGMLRLDERASFVAVTNFLKYNPPENPNVVRSWGNVLDLIPECHEKNLLIQRVKSLLDTLPKAFAEALPEPFRKGMPNPEPEPEPEPERERVRRLAPHRARARMVLLFCRNTYSEIHRFLTSLSSLKSSPTQTGRKNS